ncbi:hypothetical protein HK100_009752 [Physocladia obscura]|uniref:Uncharacterized protein n=1 Tax=Physocladia obscura TaxID=109957 RepID=A0AAD5XAY6_9FUNG|nr:hypothetical protein HK100_009752 [Physocladia obscura]
MSMNNIIGERQLPNSVLRRVYGWLETAADRIHFVSASQALFDAASSGESNIPGIPVDIAIARQRAALSIGSITPTDELALLILIRTHLACPVCLEPLFATANQCGINSPHDGNIEQNGENSHDYKQCTIASVASAVRNCIALSSKSTCLCCHSIPIAHIIAQFRLTPSPHIPTPWICPNSNNGCTRIYCSRLCGSPVGTLLKCENEDECGGDSRHGCICCFTHESDVNRAVMESDGGLWECVYGLDDDSDNEFADADDLDGEEDLFADPDVALAGGTFLGFLGDGGGSHRQAKRRRVNFDDDAREQANNGSRSMSGEQHRWWSAAAKKCRERGSVRDECICGECDFFNDVVDSE